MTASANIASSPCTILMRRERIMDAACDLLAYELLPEAA